MTKLHSHEHRNESHEGGRAGRARERDHAHHDHAHDDHSHEGQDGHSHDLSGKSRRQLLIALGLTSVILVVEAVASFMTGSLALLSDAAHMATDAAALGIALLAVQLGTRKADS